ncbi:MAG: O-antigen ligase family protein [Cytophagales bacterium]|nr:O-antigen ligase family protein [Cytophagales bacterium]
MKLTNLIIILLFINWLTSRKISVSSFIILLLPIFYLLHIIGIAYSSNIDQAFFELEKKISFIVFPLIFASPDLLNKNQYKFILNSFVGSCLIGSLLCLGYATTRFFLTGETTYFFYHDLSEIIGMHAIYLAMYCCFSFFILVYYYKNDVLNRGKVAKVIYLFGLMYLVVFIFLLSARIMIAAFTIITCMGLLSYGYRSKQLLKVMTIFVLLIGFCGSLIFLIPNNLERFKEAINYKSQYAIDKQYGGRSTRELIWECGIDVIRENILLGVGTGDTQDELQKCYKQDENKNWALLYRPDFKYNAHSQYLQTFIDLGVAGIFGLLMCFIAPLRISLLDKNYLAVSFFILFILGCITESMFELNKGIVFFSFFSSFFIAQSFSNTEKVAS